MYLGLQLNKTHWQILSLTVKALELVVSSKNCLTLDNYSKIIIKSRRILTNGKSLLSPDPRELCANHLIC